MPTRVQAPSGDCTSTEHQSGTIASAPARRSCPPSICPECPVAQVGSHSLRDECPNLVMEREYDSDLMAKLGNDHRKVRLLDWLCTAPALRDPEDLERLADELEVTSRTLRNWKSSQSFLKVLVP